MGRIRKSLVIEGTSGKMFTGRKTTGKKITARERIIDLYVQEVYLWKD